VANTVAGVASIGGSGGFCGKVGTDQEGAFFRQDLTEIGVPLLCDPGPGPTGTCTVMITRDGQRTMMTHLGVSGELGPGDLDRDAIARAKYLLLEGYLLPHPESLEASLEAISVAKDSGAKVALSVSDPFIVERRRDLLWELIEGPVDLLLLNAVEAEALTGLKDPEQSAREIHLHSPDVALTNGAMGSFLASRGEVFLVEVVPLEAVDTTGAGDMYAAGLLFGLTHNLTWAQSGHLGSHLASRLINEMGSRLKTRVTAEEISGIISRHPG
jgi:sugar/nucleoside kinase (ribokinase family)